jgi:dTMP kinase
MRLEQHGMAVVPTREPTAGPVGRQIRATLRQADGAAHRAALPWMFAADRADHVNRLVQPSLQDGSWVVSDRYYHSSLAYQSVEHPLSVVDELNRHFLAPDLTLYLSVPVTVCLARIAKRRDELEIFEERDVLQATAARYRAVLDMLVSRGQHIVEIDASGDIESISETIWAHVQELSS